MYTLAHRHPQARGVYSHLYISPLSLPQALHTAASELPQKPDTLVTHSHAGQAQYPINKDFLENYRNDHFLAPIYSIPLNVLIQANPTAHDPVAYYSVRTLWVQSRASHVCSFMHLTIQPYLPTPTLCHPDRHCTHYQLYHRKTAHFLHNTAHVVNAQVHHMLYMSVIFFVIKI